ncbi:hypothetical protein [Spiractinospora alimapuensis]|uniref:hypothetical protein n=1 Tax=Spiractinospora alimapuensis TaxID=2820884 RepID=UPI001F47DAC7|nr:hypothetical protein [Spiractinospora alimapuensis]
MTPRVCCAADSSMSYAGCAAGMAFPGLSRVISQLVDDSWSGGLVALLIGLPLAVILTVIVWRSVLRAVLGGGPAPRPWPIALSLTGGLLVGQLMLPALPPTTWGRSLVEAPVPAIVLAGFLFGGCYLVTRWMSRDAALWLSVTRAQWPMWAAAVVGTSMVGFVLMTWFAAVQTLSLTSHHWSGMVTWAITVTFTDGHVWLTVAVGLGASLPMAAYLAWARRRGVGSPSFQLGHRVCPPWLPVGAAALTTLGMAVAVALMTPLLRSAAPEVGDDFSPTASATALLPTFLLVGVVALAGAAILGWTLGGAGSSGRVLNAVAASVFLQAFFVVPATRIGGVTGNCARIPNPTLDCWSDRLFSDLAASSGVSLGTYAFVVLLLPAWGAALTASAARALLLGAPREFHPPRRHVPSVLATAALLLVTVIAVVDQGARLAPGEGVGGGPLTESVTQAAREPVQRESREGTETCEAVDQNFQEVGGTILPTENVTLSQVRATRAMSESTDPTLAAFSEPALDVLRDGHRPTSWDHLMAAKFYCGVVHPGTGILI